jgi:hypothetical protein
MKDDEEEADDVEGDDEGIFQEVLKFAVGVGAAGDHIKLEKREDDKPRNEHAADFAQDEAEIFPALEPPIGGDALAIPARVIEGVGRRRGRGFHFPPQGITTDLTQSSAAVSLYCWMAPAGSTCLGQTRVHSPTKVQPQMASCWERTGKRSLAP